MTEPALTTPIRTPEDADAALRPKSLAEFVGQAAARENLRIFIEAGKANGREDRKQRTGIDPCNALVGVTDESGEMAGMMVLDNLQPGQWRDASSAELRTLRQQRRLDPSARPPRRR